MTTFGLYGARLSLAVWQHFTCYFLFTYYFVLSLKNKYTIPYHTNVKRNSMHRHNYRPAKLFSYYYSSSTSSLYSSLPSPSFAYFSLRHTATPPSPYPSSLLLPFILLLPTSSTSAPTIHPPFSLPPLSSPSSSSSSLPPPSHSSSLPSPSFSILFPHSHHLSSSVCSLLMPASSTSLHLHPPSSCPSSL